MPRWGYTNRFVRNLESPSMTMRRPASRESSDPARCAPRSLHRLAFACLPVALLPAAPALAQRAEGNAVVGATDAFGSSVGNDRIGLYGQDDVRGFSPIEAGNTRIEGLYFAPVDNMIALVSEANTVRVGIAAQDYVFPAPTGIVDYTLNRPIPHRNASLSTDRQQFGSLYTQLDTHWDVDANTRLLVSAAARHQQRHEGGDFKYYSGSATLAWQPYAGAVVMPFFGFQNQRDDYPGASLFVSGDMLPHRLPRRLKLTQPWENRSSDSRLYGAVAKLPLGAWQVDAGLFRAERDFLRNFADIFQNLRPDGTTPSRVIVYDPNNRDRVWSGEARLGRGFVTGALAHRLVVSLRGRRTTRSFGGSQRFFLGESTTLAQDVRPQPVLTDLPDDHDAVQQTTIGGSYRLAMANRFTLNASLSHSRYRKQIDYASATQPDVQFASNPWLGSVTGTITLARRLMAYGGYVRGFEDPMVAPDAAVNRGTAPPALRTRQAELGLRYALFPGVALIGGVFEIRKPYYNLDAARVFRNLGTIRNRGLELSLAGTAAAGVSIVAGTVLLDPRIDGMAVDSGLVGGRPVGSTKRRSILNVDWRLDRGTSPLSLDLAFESFSSKVANVENTLKVPARVNLNLGFRYRFPIAKVPALLRIQVANVFNDYGYNVQPSGAIQYIRSRVLLSEFQLDF